MHRPRHRARPAGCPGGKNAAAGDAHCASGLVTDLWSEAPPRRVRATLGGEQIFDTTRAWYVWEWPYYPQYYIPVEDIDKRFLVDEHHEPVPACRVPATGS